MAPQRRQLCWYPARGLRELGGCAPVFKKDPGSGSCGSSATATLATSGPSSRQSTRCGGKDERKPDFRACVFVRACVRRCAGVCARERESVCVYVCARTFPSLNATAIFSDPYFWLPSTFLDGSRLDPPLPGALQGRRPFPPSQDLFLQHLGVGLGADECAQNPTGDPSRRECKHP